MPSIPPPPPRERNRCASQSRSFPRLSPVAQFLISVEGGQTLHTHTHTQERDTQGGPHRPDIPHPPPLGCCFLLLVIETLARIVSIHLPTVSYTALSRVSACPFTHTHANNPPRKYLYTKEAIPLVSDSPYPSTAIHSTHVGIRTCVSQSVLRTSSPSRRGTVPVGRLAPAAHTHTHLTCVLPSERRRPQRIRRQFFSIIFSYTKRVEKPPKRTQSSPNAVFPLCLP